MRFTRCKTRLRTYSSLGACANSLSKLLCGEPSLAASQGCTALKPVVPSSHKLRIWDSRGFDSSRFLILRSPWGNIQMLDSEILSLRIGRCQQVQGTFVAWCVGYGARSSRLQGRVPCSPRLSRSSNGIRPLSYSTCSYVRFQSLDRH